MSVYDRYDNVVFLDTETTGLDPAKEQIIELAMLTAWKGKVIEEYDQYVSLNSNHDRLPDKITELTGITDDILKKNGIPEKEMSRELNERISRPGGTLIVAYNTQFDASFLKNTATRQASIDLMQSLKRCDYLDALTMFRDRASYPHKLSDAIKWYGLGDKVKNSHRAVDDTKALKEIFDAMTKERDDSEKYVNLFGYNPKYGIKDENKLPGIIYAAQNFNKWMTDEKNALYSKAPEPPVKSGKSIER